MKGVIDFAVGILVIVLLFFITVMASLIMPNMILHSKIKEYHILMREIVIQHNLNHLLNARVNASNNLRVIDYIVGLRNCIENKNEVCRDYYVNDLVRMSNMLKQDGIIWGFYLGKVPIIATDCEKEYYYFNGRIPIGI